MGKYQRKKKRTGAWVIGIALLLALVFFGSQQFSLDGASGGATIFSVDQVDIQGRGNSTQWVISLSMNQGGERVFGSVTEDTLEQFNLGSFPATDFTIDFNLEDVTCDYELEATDKNVGKLWDAWTIEQCLGFTCPYDYIDLDDTIRVCQAEGGDNCERMVDLNQLEGAGEYSEWCSWFPEESNVAVAGECQLLPSSGRQVTCRTHSPYPEGCGVCRGAACESIIENKVADWWRNYPGDICCFETGATSGRATDNGDWRVEHISMVPEYNVLDINTVANIKYNAKIKVTLEETGEVIERTITQDTNIVDLGEFGEVKWVGNLVGTQFCPQPAVDTAILRDIDSNSYKDVDNGAGSIYQSYIDNLNEMSRIDLDRYTFTLITPTTVRAIDPGIGGGPIFSRFTLLNAEYEEIKDIGLKNNGCTVTDEGNAYTCDTDTSPVLPLLKLTVKAEKVGIIVPDGQPDIIGASTVKSKALLGFETIVLEPNQQKELWVGVKNIGLQTDSFDLNLDCPFPISQQTPRIAIDSQEEEVVPIIVSGVGNIQTCTITANSVGHPENRDEEPIKVIANPNCDIFGADPNTVVFTQYGCYARSPLPSTPCKTDEFWLANLDRCVAFDEIENGEDRLALLEEVGERDCNLQCNGNKECVLACLQKGNVKPVCIGIDTMMTLNDYLCDYENQVQTVLPQTFQNQIWLDAPICNYVCAWGYEGENCAEIDDDVRFDFTQQPPTASLVQSSATCESCFDGVKNQDEEDTDCGGVCETKYGRDKSCTKLAPPLHCYNHEEDGDEEGIDCGGSCQFSCDEVWKPLDVQQPKPISAGGIWGFFVVIGVGLLIVAGLYGKKKGWFKRSKGRKR